MIAGNGKFEPKRGRPTAEQSAAIDRVIREAAMQTFLDKGYEGTSMEAVAAKAGVPRSTLYKRFPDKRILLRAVLSERVTNWCLAHRREDLGDDLETRLKRLTADILLQAISEEVQAFWALTYSAWRSPEDAAERQDAIGYAHMVDELEREIREYAPRSGIDVSKARVVATTLMAMLGGWIEYVAPTVARPEQESVRFADAAVDLLVHGSRAW